MDICVAKISRKIKKKRLVKLFKKNIFNEIIDTFDYDKLRTHLVKNTTKLNFNYFFNYLVLNYSNYLLKNQEIKIKTLVSDKKFNRKFMTVLIIDKFKDIVLNNNTEYNESLVLLSKDIITTIKNIYTNNDITYFLKLMINTIKYIETYNLWETLDKRITTYTFLISYYNNITLKEKLDSNINPNLYPIFIENIDKDLKNISEHIRFLNDKNEIDFFNQHKDNIDFRKEIVIELFWIDIKYRLSLKNYDKKIVIELVTKTINLLKLCVPNRTDIHRIIEDSIDVKLLKQYIDNDIHDNNLFHQIIFYIIQKIKEFQAPEDDKSLDEFKIRLINNFSENFYYKDILPFFFREVFNRLEKVIDDREAFILQLKNK